MVSDFEPLKWYLLNALGRRDNYVCVEPGYVRAFVSLAPGENWIGQQVLSVI
jgi:hypothetical protein